MFLLTIIVFASGVFVGWKSHLNKESLKKWFQGKLRKANEKTKQL